MAVTAEQISTAVTDVQATATAILATISAADPAAALPIDTAEAAIALAAELATKALAAYSAASGVAITVESVTALLPNSAPLDPPDTQS